MTALPPISPVVPPRHQQRIAQQQLNLMNHNSNLIINSSPSVYIRNLNINSPVNNNNILNNSPMNQVFNNNFFNSSLSNQNNNQLSSIHFSPSYNLNSYQLNGQSTTPKRVKQSNSHQPNNLKQQI